MANLRITVGENTFEVGDAELDVALFNALDHWLDAVGASPAQAQRAIDTATNRLKSQTNALGAVVAAHSAP